MRNGYISVSLDVIEGVHVPLTLSQATKLLHVVVRMEERNPPSGLHLGGCFYGAGC